MKKVLLSLASAALLLVGCAKESLVDPSEGGTANVDFTVQVDNGDRTKAAVDGDGNAANVNRCIMEVYYGDELFTRMYATVVSKKASFTASVVSNRTYKVVFWADCVDNASTEAGLIVDKYYTTNAEGGLQAIALKGTYAGNDDARDAFFHVGEYTVAQGGTSFGDNTNPIVLKRPFAQMNVITTDWDLADKVNGIAPDKVNVTLKNPMVCFNALTGIASEDAGVPALNYEAALYTAPAPVAPVSETEKTLSMDYLFASVEKQVIDIEWEALHGTDANVEHSFTAVPYQRNYRTNIKGKLLTATGQWNVTVDPIWETDATGEFDYAYTTVFDIKGANEFVAQNTTKKEISVTFTSQPNDAGDPAASTSEHPINAIVTSMLAENATYNIDVASTTDVLYVGDYDYSTTASGTTYDYTTILPETSSKTNEACVNLVVSDNLYIGTLVVNSPSKSVSINGQTVQSGKSYHIENLTVTEVSLHTVIVEKGMIVENLTMVKGGLEIHGTVNKAIVPDVHGVIEVRDCENLDETLVYNVLKPYIAEGYVGVKGRTTEGLWDIVPGTCKIGSTYYYYLVDAVNAAQDGQTIILLKNISGDGVVVPGGKNLSIDFNGYTYYVDGNLAGSTGTKSQCFQLLSGSTIVFKNGTVKTNIASIGVNNYANLTLQDITIDMRETSKTGQVSAMQVMNGNVKVLGNTNIYAKENPGTGDAFIAILSLYWPTNYGDIDLIVNTSGEIKGMLAYASYQCSDLTTVKDHSHFAIENGTYDVTYDMDGIENPDFKIFGGAFEQKPDDSYIAEGFEAVNESGKYVVRAASQYIARVGQTLYTSLQAAADAVQKGQTITLINNAGGVDETSSNISYSIDLNGYLASCSNNHGALHFQNCHEIIINDSKGTGRVFAEAVNGPSGHHGAVSCHNTDLVTINGGRYEIDHAYDAHNVLAAWWGDIVVNDGVFIGDLFTNNQAVPIATSSITINGGFFDGNVSPDEDGTNMSKVIINGGTFTFNPSSYMVDGKVCYIDENGYYVVANSLPAGYVWTASLAGTKTVFFKGSEGPDTAIAAAEGVVTVVLRANATANKQLKSSDLITIINDGGSYSGQMTTTVANCTVGSFVDGNATTYFVTASQEAAYAKIGARYYLTVADAINACSNNDIIELIKDVTEEENLGRSTAKSFVLDLAGHKIQKSFNNQGNAPIYLASGGTCTIRDSQGSGSIVGGNNMTGAIYSENNSTVIIEGGLITNKNSSGTVRSFCVGADGSIIIKGGFFDYGYYFTNSPMFGTAKLLEISGGNFKTAPETKYIKTGYSANKVGDWYLVSAN